MAELVTIARPYAEAIFSLAKEQNVLSQWSAMFELLVAVVTNEDVKPLLNNPNVNRPEVIDLIKQICKDKLNPEGINLLQVLSENGRLNLLPEIRQLFEQLKAVHEGSREVEIRSAFPLNEEQTKLIVSKLEDRFKCKISPHVVVDADLIGGVIIQVGDEVYDASVRSKLQHMAVALKS